MIDTDVVRAGSVVSTAVCSHCNGSVLRAQTWLLKPGAWAISGKESLDISIVLPAVLGNLWLHKIDTVMVEGTRGRLSVPQQQGT